MARPQFIYFIQPVRPDMPDGPTQEEAATIGRHFQYLKDAHANGQLILAGRTLEPPYVGIAIYEADDQEAADKFAAADPAIQAGVFELVRVQPYGVALLRTESV